MANQESELPNRERSGQRLTKRYRFDDPDMDLFFLVALGWGPAGGLSVGEAFHVASEIQDGDGDSWASAFERQGSVLDTQASAWQHRGWKRAAGEARLKAFASYRSAWQFVAPGDHFIRLFRRHRELFGQAMEELALPATRFAAPYGSSHLPGYFYQASEQSAPTVLVIGGADTCHENLFFAVGRYFLDRGYSVAIVDLPGQGLLQDQGLYWEVEAERPIAAVVDELIARFNVEPRRLALLGLSLGGYFACRAAAHERRLAAVIASTPFPRPGELFIQVARDAEASAGKVSDAASNNYQVLMWKAGVTELPDLLRRVSEMRAKPDAVEVPFLSIVGGQEGPLFQQQAREWHAAIRSRTKDLVVLGADTGADAHCQANNTFRLVQEVDGWLREVLGRSGVTNV